MPTWIILALAESVWSGILESTKGFYLPWEDCKVLSFWSVSALSTVAATQPSAPAPWQISGSVLWLLMLLPVTEVQTRGSAHCCWPFRVVASPSPSNWGDFQGILGAGAFFSPFIFCCRRTTSRTKKSSHNCIMQKLKKSLFLPKGKYRLKDLIRP